MHKNLHMCSLMVSSLFYMFCDKWHFFIFLFVFFFLFFYPRPFCTAQTLTTHAQTPPSVCVGFLQTYLYGICILQTFIWLSGLGPRGASVAWGSVSQTHTDGWARGACATLYWVSYDYPALSLSLSLSRARTHTAERDRQKQQKKSRMQGGRERETDETRKKRGEKKPKKTRGSLKDKTG